MSRKIKIFFLSVTIFTTSFFFVSYTDHHYFEIAKHLEIFSSIYRELNSFYVDETNAGELMKQSIDAMLKSLDPYTTYIPESEIEDFRFMKTGEYGGIGAVITKINDYVYISEPYEGFPAHKAGLMAGDKILEIDGVSAKGKSTEDVSKILKGEKNTKVSLLIEREQTKKPFEVSFERKKIKIESVPYYGFVEGNIGYIRLRSFTTNCSQDIKKSFQKLKKQNGEIKGLILDLRGNPGGLLIEAVRTANLFIKKGEVVVVSKGKLESREKEYKTNRDPLDETIPLVVLINQSSASASEIVSGSIQDLDRGIIIGQRSFGKGLVQETRDVGYNAKLKLTIAKYYLPSGRCVQALDYSNRNQDGSVGKIVDSLITSFYTRNGRTVYDGGGVNPDIFINESKTSNILISLLQNRHFFNYATTYRINNETIGDLNEFKITEDDFEKFTLFLSDKEYKYKTETERLIKKLQEVSEAEEYFNLISQEHEVISEKIKENKKRDLVKNKDEIKQILTGEIASRYYFQKGRIRVGLLFDLEIDSAISILNNQERYDYILSSRNADY